MTKPRIARSISARTCSDGHVHIEFWNDAGELCAEATMSQSVALDFAEELADLLLASDDAPDHGRPERLHS